MNSPRSNGDRIVFGLLIMLAGVVLLLDNQGIITIGSVWQYWPLIFVALGLGKIVRAESRSEQGSGVWLLLFGVWLLISVLNMWGLTFGETWPAIFIVFGVSMLWRSLPPLTSSSYVKESDHGQ
jgi:hypothetical protein